MLRDVLCSSMGFDSYCLNYVVVCRNGREVRMDIEEVGHD